MTRLPEEVHQSAVGVGSAHADGSVDGLKGQRQVPFKCLLYSYLPFFCTFRIDWPVERQVLAVGVTLWTIFPLRVCFRFTSP
jgi:hypothetical protein